MTLIGIGLAIVFSAFLAITLRRNMQEISSAAQLMSQGDLEIDIPEPTQNEVGEISRALSVFRDSIIEARRVEKEMLKREKEEEERRIQDEKRRIDEERRFEAAERAREDEKRREEAERAEQERIAEMELRAKEKKAAEEIAVVVEACAEGDFTHRLNLEDKDGIFKELCVGINQIGEVAASGLESVRLTLSNLADGNLTYRMHGDFNGVFEEISEAANKTASSLEDAIRTISQSSDSVQVSAREIATASNELARRTEDNSVSLERAAEAIEELSATVVETSERSSRANEGAKLVHVKAGEGTKIIQDAMDAMALIQASSKEISSITKMIDDIALQTNLLALNASVEAARAGASGQGFAVVAGEVQELAKRSQKAANEITMLLERSENQVTAGSALVAKSGQSFGEITKGVQQVAEEIEWVAASSLEQRSAVDSINVATTKLDASMKENSAMYEETSTVTHSLSEDASQLAALISKFKISEKRERGSEDFGGGITKRDIEAYLQHARAQGRVFDGFDAHKWLAE